MVNKIRSRNTLVRLLNARTTVVGRTVETTQRREIFRWTLVNCYFRQEEAISTRLTDSRDPSSYQFGAWRLRPRADNSKSTVKIIGPFLSCACTIRTCFYWSGGLENFACDRPPRSDRPPIKERR